MKCLHDIAKNVPPAQSKVHPTKMIHQVERYELEKHGFQMAHKFNCTTEVRLFSAEKRGACQNLEKNNIIISLVVVCPNSFGGIPSKCPNLTAFLLTFYILKK